MLERGNIGNIVTGVLQGHGAEGVEAELQRHFGIARDSIPLAMLLEKRAAATTTGDEPNTSSPVIPQIFPSSCCTLLRNQH